MNLRLVAAYTLIFVGSTAVPIAAAQISEEDDSPRFIVRISRPFLAQLAEKSFSRETPINDVILGAVVEGSAHTDGRFGVKLQEDQKEDEDQKVDGFRFLVRGQVASRSIARRGGIAVHSNGHAQFNAVRPVAFTGKEFVGQPVTVSLTYHSELEGIAARRSGPFGRLVSRIAYPSVVRSMPEGDRISESKLHDQLTKSIMQDSDDILVTLNRVTGVANTVVLLQKVLTLSNKDLPIQLTLSDEYLLMGIAAQEQALIKLPVLNEQDRAPMEIWVRRLAKKNELNPVPALRVYWLALGPVLKTLVRKSPDATEMIDNVQVTELANWRVVRLYLNPPKESGARVASPPATWPKLGRSSFES